MHRDMRQGTARWDSVSMGVGSLCPNHLHLKKDLFHIKNKLYTNQSKYTGDIAKFQKD